MPKTNATSAIALALTLCLTVTATAQKKSPLVTTRTDRYSGRTTISTIEIEPHGNLMLAATVSYTGQKPERFDTVRLLLVGADSFWPRIDQNVAVGFIVDDGPPQNYNAEYSSSFLVAGIMSTSYGLDLSLENLASIACGRSVEMKVASTEMRLKPKHIASLKALLTTAGGFCQTNP